MIQELEEIYGTAANGDMQAKAWLAAWHYWCHRIDDHIDEKEPAVGVIDIAERAAVLFSSPFWLRHVDRLAPLVAVIAEEYRTSLDAGDPVLSEALRISGNQMVLLVAYLCGGNPCVRATSKLLWPFVVKTQLLPDEQAA